MMNKWYLYLILMWFTSCITISNDMTDVKVEKVIESSIQQSPKNIILMIGDGMGLVQITAGMYTKDNYTYLEEFPVVGLHKCHSEDNLVTDSAAGATAFSTGEKTINGAVAMSADNLALPTILEQAEASDMATGLIAACGITHATPASFIAHNISRDNKEEIALQFLNTDVDLLIGGARNKFDKRETDQKDLIKSLRNKSYIIKNYRDGSGDKFELDPNNPCIYFTADDHPKKVSEGRDYLNSAALAGVDFLKKRSENGFFLMIEGSQIDWGGHDNDSDYIITEFIDFDQTVKSVLDWAKKDGETLVIVTADHETGGYAINAGAIGDTLSTAFTTGGHTAVMIPVFAYGPGSEQFGGIYENTAIYHKMKKLLSLN